ncbi:hypothetical protein FOZ63_001328, partial [Perkinsus olseni]
PDAEVRATVTGPDPGYNATSGIFTTLAMVLLTERESLGTKKGGVYTPAAVFRGSTAAKRLTEEGYAAFSANLLDVGRCGSTAQQRDNGAGIAQNQNGVVGPSRAGLDISVPCERTIRCFSPPG